MSRETRCKLTGFRLSASSEPGSVSQVPKSPGQLRAASPGFPARLFPGSAPGRHSVFLCCPCPAQLPVPRARCPWVSLTEAVTSPGAQAEPRGTPLGPGLPRTRSRCPQGPGTSGRPIPPAPNGPGCSPRALQAGAAALGCERGRSLPGLWARQGLQGHKSGAAPCRFQSVPRWLGCRLWPFVTRARVRALGEGGTLWCCHE